ncbi:hypothetical protein B0I35DRAFT_120403 [Stachybotrys elegans]|uniref:Autophagy-related protein 2 n=1 Tax=Stachybotrys elegans TaxID=80388 RepID=A0A8K0SY37_9HYPO|nr:hypothetical protein B0I35DRAFT_120403 [Stachybotrys elegans]
MATLFQSFQSSSMPKRLLQYALSRLELLDAEALDLGNLDFALGRNTVLEFRDVGIRTKKLEKLLQLPPTFRLQKAKVLLLRVTVPMDFYTSPIQIEVDGVDVRLSIPGTDKPKPKADGKSPEDATIVPNTVDLAQSFLETQPTAEKRKLEQALASETQDLGASTSVSDDGSEDESSFGTGQPLSLPNFLAAFLQGIVDRMQVKIKAVTFQLDLDVPVDPAAQAPEPVSFQIALDGVDVEGVTTQSEQQASPTISKEGMRHVSLNRVRAYLISEANVFSALAPSPSLASPSVLSSPSMTRNLPSRQTSSLSQGSFHEQPMVSLQESFREHMSDRDDESESDYPLGDSEDALAIPYDLDEPEDDPEDESPVTPRASIYHETGNAMGESLFHSMLSSGALEQQSTILDYRDPEVESTGLQDSIPALMSESTIQDPLAQSQESSRSGGSSKPQSESSDGQNTYSPREDLTQSQLYTHEEAQSMYMSAFSESGSRALPLDAAVQHEPPAPEVEEEVRQPDPVEPSEDSPAAQPMMPGGWGDDFEESTIFTPSKPEPSDTPLTAEVLPNLPGDQPTGDAPGLESDANTSTESQRHMSSGDSDVPTPKGLTRLVKEVLTLDNISVYIPSHHEHVDIQSASHESVIQLSQTLSRSHYPQAPGAFSIHGLPSGSQMVAPDTETTAPALAKALEVILSPMRIQFDASIAFLLSMVASRLLGALKEGYPASENPGKKDQPPARPDINLKLEEIVINFISRLDGVADTPRRFFDPSAFAFDNEVLLNLTMQHLDVSVAPKEVTIVSADKTSSTKETAVSTNISLQKFRFGYASGDIISFDKAKPMSTSVRDTFLSTGFDVGIKILQTSDGVRTDIETLPAVVQIDLQRLDETFGWFGGLSSFLNMSTSMTGSNSPVMKSTPPPPPKPRGVHFIKPAEIEAPVPTSTSKVNVRIGGSLVELMGKDCSIAAETSALKFVSRGEGIGIACTMMRVSGPYLFNSMADAPISTEIGGVRLDFLMAPKDSDLESLLELIMPSKVKFDEGNDEIMVDTLLRQRRKGSVLRASVDTVNIRVRNMNQLAVLPTLGEELAKLSTVAKYLPEDDRPGLLTLGKIHKLGANLDFGAPLGQVALEVKKLDVAHISVPSLVAIAIQGVSVKRNNTEELVASSVYSPHDMPNRGPVIMARMIGDEIEPRVKLKLRDLSVEYRVPTIMDLLGLAEDATPQDFEASLAASVANLGDQAQTALARQPPSPVEKAKAGKPMTLDVGFQDCLFGLNPLNLPSKLVIAMVDARLEVVLPKDVEMQAVLDINKASILLIDDAAQATTADSSHSNRRRSSSAVGSRQVTEMLSYGFIDICWISSAKAVLKVVPGPDPEEKQIEVELRDDLLVLETCADSMQTLIALSGALKPPTPPSKENKYRTNVVPVEDLLASISAEAFGKPEGEYDFDQDFAGAQELAGSGSELDFGSDQSLRVESQFFAQGEELFDATKASMMSHGTTMEDTNEGVLLTGFDPSSSGVSQDSDDLVIHENFFGHSSGSSHNAKIWNSNKNSYDTAPDRLVKHSPLRVSVRDVHVIWNLYDGYDWHRTREVITKAVHEVENKAYERQSRLAGHQVYEEEIEDEEAIGDFLFNSIYIGIPANRDPQELSRAINEGLNDFGTDTESVATTSLTATTNRTARPHRPRSKRLKLGRSKRHKITFELQGINVDMYLFPPDAGETMSSIDVRVNTLDVYDHVPTSTWKKFATYDRDQGEREMGSDMVHLELLTVKPMPDLGASEIVLRATILPLRLHVDQDALDFITRFFEFKDDSIPVNPSPSDIPFIQRAEINSVPVKLDFKPKRVDYIGLRSGRTTEFMNFIVLEESRMVLRHVIIYGVSGFDRLGRTLNDIWTPDVRNNQLPGVVAGLAPVRSLVNIGSGFKDLIEIPLKEYQKDGRVVRSISKGAAAFARTTGTEIVKLGAKLAIGTQYALQGAENMLSDQKQPEGGWEEDDLDAEDKKQISLYADQPTGVIQGIRGGYRSLTRDVNMARDAIIAIPGEVMESQSAGGLAKAVWKRAPTIIFRPAVGVTNMIGQTLMGATNAIDPNNKRRIDEKYKKH